MRPVVVRKNGTDQCLWMKIYNKLEYTYLKNWKWQLCKNPFLLKKNKQKTIINKQLNYYYLIISAIP